MGHYRHPERVYRYGTLNGYPEYDAETHTPKKFIYIKARKDGHVCYIDAEGNLTDESHAAVFSEEQAGKIIPQMKKDPRYKNCEILPFETSYRLNSRAEANKNETHTAISADRTPHEIKMSSTEKNDSKKPASKISASQQAERPDETARQDRGSSAGHKRRPRRATRKQNRLRFERSGYYRLHHRLIANEIYVNCIFL